jgi:hypothetical protein
MHFVWLVVQQWGIWKTEIENFHKEENVHTF